LAKAKATVLAKATLLRMYNKPVAIATLLRDFIANLEEMTLIKIMAVGEQMTVLIGKMFLQIF